MRQHQIVTNLYPLGPLSNHSSCSSSASLPNLHFPHGDIKKHSISSEDDLDAAIAQDLAVLGPIEAHYHRQRKWWLFSMIWAHQIWWIIALSANLPLLIHVARRPRSEARTSFTAQISLVNLALTVLVRNELILAGLYWLVSRCPFRRFYAHRMLHSIGGLHVGCAISTFTWIIFYVVELGRIYDPSSTLSVALFATALALPAGICVMIVFSLRPIRERFHNAWELTHRYVGWTVLADLVAHLVIKALTLASPIELLHTSLPYLTIFTLVSVFYVWFTIRKPRVSIRANSSVAVIAFPGRPTGRTGTFVRISRNAVEWHAFSVAMTDLEKHEFSVVVAKAGDWTSTLIRDCLEHRGPGRMWIRDMYSPGFMYMHSAYKKVVTVCTGAGIAPALPYIEQATNNIMLIWIANGHRKTYGEAVWETVNRNLPASQLVLHDTSISGRPDIGTLIERAAKANDAEAVFVVSNDAYTGLCANICWRKGLRCYGATRDS